MNKDVVQDRMGTSRQIIGRRFIKNKLSGLESRPKKEVDELAKDALTKSEWAQKLIDKTGSWK